MSLLNKSCGTIMADHVEKRETLHMQIFSF